MARQEANGDTAPVDWDACELLNHNYFAVSSLMWLYNSNTARRPQDTQFAALPYEAMMSFWSGNQTLCEQLLVGVRSHLDVMVQVIGQRYKTMFTMLGFDAMSGDCTEVGKYSAELTNSGADEASIDFDHFLSAMGNSFYHLDATLQTLPPEVDELQECHRALLSSVEECNSTDPQTVYSIKEVAHECAFQLQHLMAVLQDDRDRLNPHSTQASRENTKNTVLPPQIL